MGMSLCTYVHNALIFKLLFLFHRARAEVLVTLTQDLGKILSSIHSVKIGGEGDLSSAVQVAQVSTVYSWVISRL